MGHRYADPPALQFVFRLVDGYLVLTFVLHLAQQTGVPSRVLAGLLALR